MNCKKKFFTLFSLCMIAFICFSCTSKKYSIQEKYADKLVEHYINDVKDKYNLEPFTISWGMYGGIINLIGPHFFIEREMDISLARQLISELSNDLSARVNNSLELRPYLKNYPFDHLNTEILIGYKYEFIKEKPTAITLAYQKNGKIYYCITDPETRRYAVVHKEDFNEAKQ